MNKLYMNKFAFTLIELLAVIIILGVIALVSIPVVLQTSKKGKEDLYESQIKMLESGAISFVAESIGKNTKYQQSRDIKNLFLNKDTTSVVELSLGLLQENGNVEYNASNPLCVSKKDPNTKKELTKFFSPEKTVILVRYNGSDFTYEITYKVSDGNYNKEELRKSCTIEVEQS